MEEMCNNSSVKLTSLSSLEPLGPLGIRLRPGERKLFRSAADIHFPSSAPFHRDGPHLSHFNGSNKQVVKTHVRVKDVLNATFLPP